MNFLSKDQLREMVPVAFATEPTRDVSKQYVFANTETVVDDLAKEGWLPRQASQRNARAGVTTQFSPHFIRFSHPDIVVKKDGVVDSFPEILLQNRHDGLGAFKFSAGFFRLVCSNGLVIMTESFAQVSIPHKGYTFDELREVVQKRVISLPGTIEIMNNMQGRKMTKAESHALATDAYLIRAGIDLRGWQLDNDGISLHWRITLSCCSGSHNSIATWNALVTKYKGVACSIL